jgi:hypothetical protein
LLAASPEGRAALRARLGGLLAASDMAGLSSHMPASELALLARAVHLNADHGALMALMVGLGAPPAAPPWLCVPMLT